MQNSEKKQAWEPLGGGVETQVSAAHRACPDTVLPAHSSPPGPAPPPCGGPHGASRAAFTVWRFSRRPWSWRGQACCTTGLTGW